MSIAGDTRTRHASLAPPSQVDQHHPGHVAAEVGDTVCTTGRLSIVSKKLLQALLLQVRYSIRSDRLLMAQLDYNQLFCWFVGLDADAPV